MHAVRAAVLSVIGVCLAGGTLPAVSQQAPPRRPNVLFIMADDLNDDASTFGHPIVKTPNLDRIAARGVRFDRAYTQFPLCNPSRASLMTGLRPDTIKVHDLTAHFRTAVPDVVTLPQMLQRAGYVAARVGKIYHYGNPGQIGTDGLDDRPSWTEVVNPRGIDKDEEKALTILTPGRGIGASLSYYASPAPDEQHTDGKVASETIALLEKHKGRPFFIAAGFYRPHCPFIAPKKYFDLHPLDRIPAPPFGREALAGAPPSAMQSNWNLDANGEREAIRAYYASISFLDAQVGRLLDAVDRLGLSDNTIIVFASDHGYHLGEGGLWMKQTLFERSARTPLIVAGAGVPATGRASTRVVEFIDIFPTLAALAGVQPPKGLEGRSLQPLLKDPGADWGHPALTQVRRGNAATGIMGYSVRTDRWRYTEWADGKSGTELYDEVADPQELKNLAASPDHQKTIADMQRLLRGLRGKPGS